MRLQDIFTSQAFVMNWTESANTRIPYLGASLFPARKKTGLDLSWLKGSSGLPVSLKPSVFDAKPTFRDRIGVNKVETEMPFFREAYLIKEKDRQEIMRVQDSNDPYAQAVLNNIFNDTANLIDGANVVPERMIMQLLAPVDGKPGIRITANNVNYIYDYDPKDEFKSKNFIELTGSGLWSDEENADPLEDLRQASDAMEDRTGNKPAIAIMSRKTANYLLKSKKLRGAILAQNSTPNIYLTDTLLNSFVFQLLGINIVVYSKKFKDESKTTQQFYPDNMVTLIPQGTLGSTFYGTTPEEADLMNNPSETPVAIVNTGVAITTIFSSKTPVNLEVIASEIVLPSFERIDEISVLKVA